MPPPPYHGRYPVAGAAAIRHNPLCFGKVRDSDFLHFRLHRVSITGNPLGDGLPVRRTPVPLRSPDPGVFHDAEIALVETVLGFYGATDAGGAADAPGSPDSLDLPWESAGLREVIPYDAFDSRHSLAIPR